MLTSVMPESRDQPIIQRAKEAIFPGDHACDNARLATLPPISTVPSLRVRIDSECRAGARH